MRKIKVAFFADMLVENFDGAARTIYQIIQRIDRSRFEFFFITGSAPGPDFQYKYYLVPSIEIPKNEDYKMAIPALAFFEMNNAMLIFKPDVIHISSPSFLGRYALDYGRNNHIPVITIYHTHFISYIDYYFKDAKFLIDAVKAFVISRNKSFYNGCNRVLVPSQSLMDELAGYDFDVSKMKLWPRGMNVSLFSPEKKNTHLKKEMGLDRPVVLFASRLVWEKNLTTLVSIYEKNEALGSPYIFVVAGDGVAREELQQQMPNAVFLGNLDHEALSIWYASADVFLFTSETETYGNVVVEAMASGLPVVVANAGGPNDLVDQYVTGIKCDPRDADAFYAGINLYMTDEQLRSTIVKNALQYARSLNWDQLTATYFEMVASMTSQKA